MILSGWGNYPRLNSRVVNAEAPRSLSLTAFGGRAVIARGAGRAYGDAAIGADLTVAMQRLDRMMAFDDETGVLTVEAGVRLSTIISTFLPRGFFPPVVPGTSNVTVGGMIAANVHGKNHHLDGGIGQHLERLTMVGPTGDRVVCSPDQNPELFRSTVGGMGLTGLICDATLRLRRVQTGYVRQHVVVAQSLDEVLRAFDDAAQATYTVAWIDGTARGATLGRSLLFVGEHADLDSLPPELRSAPLGWRPPPVRPTPFDLPSGVLNPLSIKAFNELYFRKGAAGAKRGRITPWKPYFFPLDALEDWNRLYGRRGFLQHQFVVPKAHGRDALGEILERVAARASASFLAVLKLLGDDETGIMSFPKEGYTLALDFPVTDANLALMDELDACVVRYGGRLYLAKDARQSRETLEAGYPDLAAFRAFRRDSGADVYFRSALSERLGL